MRVRSLVVTASAIVVTLTFWGVGHAAQGDCGQPLSTGDSSTASDALFTLRAAVGSETCDNCVCDVDLSGTTTAGDALFVLKAAVGEDVAIECSQCIVDCVDLVWSGTTGQPFDRLTVQGIPQRFGPAYAEVAMDVATFAQLDEAGDMVVLIPVHPSGDLGGGTIDVTITDGTNFCPPQTVTIEPLPAGVPGTAVAAGDLLGEIAEFYTGLFDTTPAAIADVDDLRTLPAALIPAALAQAVLDSPANPDSLVRMLDGTSPRFPVGDTTILDALFTKIGVTEALQRTLDDWQAREFAPQASSARRIAFGVRAEDSGHNGNMDSCLPFGDEGVTFEIDTAAKLSEYMQEHRAGADGLQGLSSTVASDIAWLLVSGVQVFGGPLGSTIANIAGALVFVEGKYDEIRKFLYPSVLTRMEVDLGGDEVMPEDRMHGGGALPEFSDPSLWAKNEGWNLTRPTLESLLQILGLVTSVGSSPVDFIWQEVVGAIIDQLPDVPCFRIPPTEWGPVTQARSAQFVTPLWFGESVDQVEFEFFVPAKIGDSEFRLKTSEEAFAGPVIEKTLPVEVRMKRVDFSQTEYRVQRGDILDIFASVSDAKHPDLVEWTIPPFVDSADPQYVGNGQHTLSIGTPEDKDLYPFQIVLRSTSAELAPESPPRQDVAIVDTLRAEIRIEPAPGCLDNGESVSLEGVITDLPEEEDDSVTWSKDGQGSFLSTTTNPTTFTAPAGGQGETIIRVVLDVDDETFDEITVRYGECLCEFQGSVSGGFGLAFDGPAGFEIRPDGALKVRLDSVAKIRGEGTPVVFGAVTTGPNNPLSPGQYALVDGGASRSDDPTYGSWSASYIAGLEDFDCAGCGGTLTITSIDQITAVGSLIVTAPLQIPDPDDSGRETVTLTASFVAVSGSTFDPSSPYVQCRITYVP